MKMTKMTRANDLNTATKQQLYEYDLDLNSISLSHTTNKQTKKSKQTTTSTQTTNTFIYTKRTKIKNTLNSTPIFGTRYIEATIWNKYTTPNLKDETIQHTNTTENKTISFKTFKHTTSAEKNNKTKPHNKVELRNERKTKKFEKKKSTKKCHKILRKKHKKFYKKILLC